MYNYDFDNLNQALVGMNKKIRQHGVVRRVRGSTVLEIPHPVTICIHNPADRYVTVPGRKWNRVLPFAETLWMLLGMNDLNSLPGDYVKNLYKYSDDGCTWRGGYGPRIRAYSGLDSDYQISFPQERKVLRGNPTITDQFKYVIDKLKSSSDTRQAIISIGDPAKDNYTQCGSIKPTLDYPCTRTIHFIRNKGKLDCIVHMRSNDLIYGMSGANIPNFTLIQDLVSQMTGIPIGKYYHMVDNLHIYNDMRELSDWLLNWEEDDFAYSEWYRYFGRDQYNEDIPTLESLEVELNILYRYERGLSKTNSTIRPPQFRYTIVDDWATVFYKAHNPDKSPPFRDHYLNQVFKEPERRMKDHPHYIVRHLSDADPAWNREMMQSPWKVYPIMSNEQAYAKKIRGSGNEIIGNKQVITNKIGRIEI